MSYLIYIVASLPILLYFYIKWKYSYWKKRGVHVVEPSFPLGSFSSGRGTTQIEFFQNFYKELKKKGLKYGGIYQILSPALVPTDLELIKNILVKDFGHFTDHGMYVNEKVDPLSGNLFLLEGEKWKNHRAKLTPTFTSGKMKMMFHALCECSKGLEELLANEVKKKEPIHIKELLSRFTTDVIGSVAFGIECNCMKVPNNEFITNSFKAFTGTKLNLLIHKFVPSYILKAVGHKQTDSGVEKFFFDLVGSTIQYREENNIYRKDFLQMLIELKNTGTVTDDEIMKKSTHGTPFLTLNEITAHAFTFFVAGFETSSNTMTFTLLELAQSQDVQEKVRQEILQVLEKYNGQMTYESIAEMKYLENVVQEALRKYPPIPILPRICTKAYKVPNSDLVIDKGVMLQLPVHAIQHDPEIYPDPQKFDPDRWNPENSSNRSNIAYLSFGEGPRICIGLRFGKVQSKCGLVSILRNYRVTLNEKMQIPIKYQDTFVTGIEGGLWVNLEKL